MPIYRTVYISVSKLATNVGLGMLRFEIFSEISLSCSQGSSVPDVERITQNVSIECLLTPFVHNAEPSDLLRLWNLLQAQ